jgi:hypothetical protein
MSEIRIQQVIKVAQAKAKAVESKKEETTPEVKPQAPAVNPKSADEVLGFMANSAVVSPKSKPAPKTIEVSKYVSAEQAKGIEESMTKFFAGMEQHVGIAMKEFNLSEKQAQNLTALQFNQKFDDEDFAIVASGQRFLVK